MNMQEQAEHAARLIDAAVRCKRAIETLQETIDECRRIAVSELQISPKDFNAYVASFTQARGAA